MDGNFVKDLKAQFSNIAEMLQKTCVALADDIESQRATISKAYENIRDDRGYLSDIEETVDDFVDNVEDTSIAMTEQVDKATDICVDMKDLADGGYIDDYDYTDVQVLD